MVHPLEQWFLWFVLYSFIGWMYESILCSVAGKKLVNRGADAGFLCIPCLAGHFSCSETRIREKIREFQQMGCTLFPPLDEA